MMTKYIWSLYIKADINGIKIKRVLVDNSVGVNILLVDNDGWVNILSLVTLKKVSLYIKDLKKTDVFMADFTSHDFPAEGFIIMIVKVKRQRKSKGLFIFDVQTNYAMILKCDWIHSNACIPSTLHQMLYI